MKTKIEQAKSILSLNNKELSKLLGHHERYIDRVLREGISLVQEKLIIKDIDNLLMMYDQHQQILKIEDLADYRLDKLRESDKNIIALNLHIKKLKEQSEHDSYSIRRLVSEIGIAERDKRYMKRKLQDKSLVINWLLALNLFFILFLVGKCVGWV